MAIIDSKGLFLGDRLAWCSDEAQLHWPRLYSAANNYARLELTYAKIIATAYVNFKRKPTETQFWAWIKEYRTNFLLFVYQAPDGQIWGQWQTNERYLLGHKNAEDKRSPVPPAKEQETFRKAYLKRKMMTSQNEILADLLGLAGTCENLSELVELTSVGEGEGGGEGVGKGKYKNKAQAPFVLPEWIDREAWAGYEEMRGKMRKPLTDHIRKLVVRDLDKLRSSGNDPTEVLNQSVTRGWTGVFSIKEQGHGGNYKSKTESSIDAAREAIAYILGSEEGNDRDAPFEAGSAQAGEVIQRGLPGVCG